jgi:glyoxylase-like metal-dependent hydrolase (beta-lactamase superfamily II)
MTRIHHLNCATLRPLGGALVCGGGRAWTRSRLVTHTLVVETRRGLVLVDTGLGSADVDRTRGPVHARHLRMLLWAALLPDEPVVRQIERLGFRASDVSDIVLTHLDLDHAGGLADFPDAAVHVMTTELEAAFRRPSVSERIRYAPVTWAHGPRWRLYDERRGERWFGLVAQAIEDLPELLYVPLPGHTRGHAGVAIRTDRGWLLHAGDAYVFQSELGNGSSSFVIERFQTHVSAIDDRKRSATRGRLRALAERHADQISILSAHDPDRFEALTQC